MMHQRDAARAVADAIADRLASPSDVGDMGWEQGWWPQSLAHGAAGVALLHTERAHTGLASWQRAHDWLACAAHGAVSSGRDSHLYYGAPALAFALHAAADRPGRYARALANLDRHIAATTRRRLEDAHARMDRGELPALAEFDAIRGLSGIGAYLLRRDPHADLIRAVLAYLVRLTEPVKNGGELLPGWWTSVDPAGRPSQNFPGGHANNGMAHGIGGPLALLSLAMRSGLAVHGQAEAILRICAWLDQWRQDSEAGSWWPYWVTRAQLRDGHPGTSGPSRPSWCYGTAGIARAQQLAALATGDTARQRMAEHALASALTDSGQLAATTDLSLCHGYAGLVHIALRAATDAITPELAACLPRLLTAIVPDGADTDADRLAASLLRPPTGDPGLLEGAAGIALALHTAQAGTPPVSGWDTCLLIN
jgi:hypothetical protein